MKLFRAILLLIGLLGTSLAGNDQLLATHFLNAGMTWTNIGPNQYRIGVRLIRNCE